jgi:hypothetical protein
MNILELLSEGIGERTLFHYTNFSGLSGMLETNKLKGFNYYLGGNGKFQIATVRPGMATDKGKVAKLSGATDGGIRIKIDAASLSDRARGVKIKSVAEYPISSLDIISQYSGVAKGKELNSFIKKLGRDIKAIEKKTGIKATMTKSSKFVKEFLKVHRKEYDKYGGDKDIQMLIEHYVGLIAEHKDREGEERISLKKGEGIPLDHKYLEIEIQGTDKFFSHMTTRNQKKIQDLIKKRSRLFKKNDNYKKIMNIKIEVKK